MNKVNLFFFGDSICFGQGVALHKGWVPRISKRLEEMAEGQHAEIVTTNASVNGDTTRMALERMPYHIQSQKPDAIIIQFGMNDCNLWADNGDLPRVNPDSFRGNLNEIIDRAKVAGAKKVLLNTNHPAAKPLPHTDVLYYDQNCRYNAIIRKVGTSREDVLLVDVEKAFLNRLDEPKDPSLFLLDDLIHLNQAGHDLYYEIVGHAVEEAVESLLHEP